jgi:hypothetical protein
MSLRSLMLVLLGLVVLVGLAAPAMAAGQDESQLWSGKAGILIPVSGGHSAGIALGIERQLTNSTESRSAIELDYAHPSDVNDWYLLYNTRYHVNSGGYWGWGAGLNEMDARGNTSTNLAYRLFYGQRWSRAFGEVGWLSGFRDGNSGVLLTIGTSF